MKLKAVIFIKCDQNCFVFILNSYNNNFLFFQVYYHNETLVQPYTNPIQSISNFTLIKILP